MATPGALTRGLELEKGATVNPASLRCSAPTETIPSAFEGSDTAMR
jgi:hypothetical protein